MNTITGQYLDQFPRYRDRIELPPRHVHRLDRPSHALAIWTAIAAVVWLIVLVRVW